MSDLIERDKAINILGVIDFGLDIIPYADTREFVQSAIDYIRKELEELPSARPKGEWIKNIDGNYECSKCHVAIRGEDKPIYPFCAWCGADMREREGE